MEAWDWESQRFLGEIDDSSERVGTIEFSSDVSALYTNYGNGRALIIFWRLPSWLGAFDEEVERFFDTQLELLDAELVGVDFEGLAEPERIESLKDSSSQTPAWPSWHPFYEVTDSSQDEAERMLQIGDALMRWSRLQPSTSLFDAADQAYCIAARKGSDRARHALEFLAGYEEAIRICFAN